MKAIKAIAWYLVGFILVPVILAFTPKGSRTLRWLDGVYGNKIDGIDGDAAYKAKVTTLRRFRWTQLRNPVNNLLRAYGPNGTVQAIRTTKYSVIATINGKDYPFIRRPLIGKRLWLWWGYKLLDDNRINSHLVIGQHFENQMILWPFKNKGA